MATSDSGVQTQGADRPVRVRDVPGPETRRRGGGRQGSFRQTAWRGDSLPSVRAGRGVKPAIPMAGPSWSGRARPGRGGPWGPRRAREARGAGAAAGLLQWSKLQSLESFTEQFI